MFIRYGVDLNKFDISRIKSIIHTSGNNSLPIITYLVDNRLDITKYLVDLLMCAIYDDLYLVMEYFLPMKSDINSVQQKYMKIYDFHMFLLSR